MSKRHLRRASGANSNAKVLVIADALRSRELKIDDKLVEEVWAAVWAATPAERFKLAEVLDRADAKGRPGRARTKPFSGKGRITFVDVDDSKRPVAPRTPVERMAAFSLAFLRAQEALTDGGQSTSGKGRSNQRKHDDLARNFDRVRHLTLLAHGTRRCRGENDDARDEL